MIRSCADCGSPFSVEPEEEDWFREQVLSLPKRCGRCRAQRRGVRDRYLTCARCGRTFTYPRELQLYARTYAWGTPRRCVGGCPGHADAPETDEERAMRELLERLRDRRSGQQAPPLEAVLEVEAARARARAPDRRTAAADALFRGLDEGAEGDDESTSQALRDEVTRVRASIPSPDALFGSLADEPAPAAGERGAGRAGRRRRRKRRRPRPRD